MRYLLILLCLLSLGAQAKVTVVTSILPLQQIAAAIMQGAGQPELLIKNEASAHHFAFKPSHFQLLQSTDLMIWIDRNFESGFQRVPEILRQKTIALELMRALNLKNADGHIWYSPTLLPKIVELIGQALREVDPAQSQIYQKNQQALQQKIADWVLFTQNRFTSVKPQYLLDHDFLSHFEAGFQIKAIASIHDSHDQHGGIQTLQLIEQLLEQGVAKCLLTNETEVSKIGKNFADKFSLIAYKIAISGGFMGHLFGLTQTLASCR